jgi:uncharacterized protein (TIGR00369 family)
MSSLDALIREFIVGGPLGRLLGISVEALEPERVAVRMSFRPEITTYGDVIHGGAIASLVDIAATAAVWHGANAERVRRGTTVGFTVNYLAAGRGKDLVAEARVISRGKSLCVCEVKVRGAGEDEALVASALVTYKID